MTATTLATAITNIIRSTPNKSTFFFDDAFVGLGSAIDRVGPGQNQPIRSTLNQVEWRSDVTYEVGSGVQTLAQGSYQTQTFNITSPAWFHQDGIGYVILPRSGQTLAARLQTRATNNNWYDLDHSNASNNQQVDIFQLSIDHGVNPANDQYQYLVLPSVSAAQMPGVVAGLDIEVLENSATVQAVKHRGAQITDEVTQVVFYQPGSIVIDGVTLTSEQPALVMLTRPDGDMEITVADPLHSTSQDQATITVSQPLQGPGATWDAGSGKTTIVFALSNDIALAGKPVTNRFEVEFDWGDAPAPFATLRVDDGARHFPVGPRLGDARDVELDGAPSANADGDADEDGLMFGVIGVGSAMAAVNVDLQNASSGRVDAWLDFDGDGTWQSDEQILDNVLATDVAGFETFNFSINSDAVAGETFARVRVSSIGGLESNGFAADGEVEDYKVTILGAPTVEDVIVNGGEIQRSNLTDVVVTFDSEVNAPASAFQIKQRGSDTVLDTLIVNSTVNGSGQTVTSLSFGDGGNLVADRANGGNTLVDGNYELTIDHAQIARVGGGPAMAGGFTLGDDEADNFFRFFSDQDGDRDSDGTDLVRFGATFRKMDGDDGFNSHFDVDGDNDVDGTDLVQFGRRFRGSMPFR